MEKGIVNRSNWINRFVNSKGTENYNVKIVAVVRNIEKAKKY